MSYKFQREKNKLKSILGEEIYNELKNHKMIIAGGFITSLFSGAEFNDVDIYGTNNELTYAYAEKNLSQGNIIYHTKKATMFTENELLLQLVHNRSYDNVEDIFSSFDFTACSGAYDFDKEEFVLHENFLKDIASRSLFFNSKTDYPLISLLRVSSYKEKGYSILKSEYIRMIMACMQLNITSYEELKEHIGGLYGHNSDELFKDLEDEDFDLEKAMNKLQYMYLEDKDFKQLRRENMFTYDIDKVLEEIDKSKKVYFSHDSTVYRLFPNEEIRKTSCSKNEVKDFLIPVEEVLNGIKLYKFVEKKKDGLFSFYDRSFEYKLNSIVSNKDDRHPHLYFNTFGEIGKSSYVSRDSKVLVEALFDVADLTSVSPNRSSSITVKKAYIHRIVPEEEYAHLLTKAPF